ncbi:MAG TPA: N-acetylmuramoyl-L-alanine amidase [Gammaproteobacteria bacterium]|nr:N-acetylmuramoyl-L-alanine amidase [Gammaproteobacteria bacterium]
MAVAPGMLYGGELTGIRLSSGPLGTRIVLDLDRAANHRLFELTDPSRLVIDLPATAARSSLRLPVPKGRVRSVRTGARPGGELRVVLDLTGPAESKSFLLEPDGTYGHRLVVDLTEPAATGEPRRVTSQYTGRNVIVVIDAGHGGKDTGAIGRSGLREKDVVLDIARRLASLVEQTTGFTPVLVRHNDTFVSLDHRLVLARETQADFFISIHADANADRGLRGATVYSIEARRAAYEQRERLADRANSADLVGGVSLSDKDERLASVLLRISQDVTTSKSIIAGNNMLEHLSRVTSLRKTVVQEGSYAVLTSPDIPSLLVETAFISNSRDEDSLEDPAFRNQLARALYGGLVDYYRANAPPDSYVSRNPPPPLTGPIRHVIARGETLSEIAERYRISLRELRRANELSGDTIRIGQVLTIPTT